MADDEEIPTEPDEEFEEVEEEADIDPAELDEDALEEEALEEDDEFVALDEDFVAADDEEDEDDTSGPVRRSVPAGEDEDEDDDIIAPDDVEADLDTILKDRLVAADDEDGAPHRVGLEPRDRDRDGRAQEGDEKKRHGKLFLHSATPGDTTRHHCWRSSGPGGIWSRGERASTGEGGFALF